MDVFDKTCISSFKAQDWLQILLCLAFARHVTRTKADANHDELDAHKHSAGRFAQASTVNCLITAGCNFLFMFVQAQIRK